MRGGIIREHEPYGEAELQAEFGITHTLVLTGSEYSAVRLGGPEDSNPDSEPVRAGSPAELARLLREREAARTSRAWH